MQDINRREEFLLRMYQTCWANITRAEDAAWKMIAAYGALFAGLSIAIPYIGSFVFVSILILFSFLAIALSLNANLWFVRNIGIISNLEREFLHDIDYGTLIPKEFMVKIPFISRKLSMWEAWWVLIIVYYVCALFVTIFFPGLDLIQKIFVGVLFLVSQLFTSIYGLSLNNRYNRFKNGAQGVTPKSYTWNP